MNNIVKSIKSFKFQATPFQISLFSSLLAVVANYSVFISFADFASTQSISIAIYSYIAFAILVFSQAFFIFFLTSFRYTAKPCFIILYLICSICAYFINKFAIVINAEMLDNVFHTDIAEASELITLRGISYLLFFGILPSAILIRTKINYTSPSGKLKYRLLIIVASILALALSILAMPYKGKIFVHYNKYVHRILPINCIQAFRKYVRVYILPQKVHKIEKIGDNAAMDKAFAQKKSLVILVIGETARADHFGINGYKRDTTPLLSARKDIMSFHHTMSCGTSTSYSLPCMISPYERERFSKNHKSETIIDILHRVNVKVLWRENNSSCYGMCANAEYQKDSYTPQERQKYCVNNFCFDEIMLEGLGDYIKNSKNKQNFIVLHTKGSHGPGYHLRYPQSMEKYKPVCSSSDLNSCSKESIINAYDNTILYTDYFLNKVITLLQKHSDINTAMIYMSDHGESLGEKGVYLHGAPYAIAPMEQKHIPFLLWVSPLMAKNYGIDLKHLKSMENHNYSHDNLFHSVLGLYKVSTPEYKKELDIFYKISK